MINIFKKKEVTKSNDLVPKGVARTIIPDEFIDGNRLPIWDNNHHLLRNSKKVIIYVGSRKEQEES